MSPANLDYDSTRSILSFQLHFQWLKPHYVIFLICMAVWKEQHVNLADPNWLHDFQVVHCWC